MALRHLSQLETNPLPPSLPLPLRRALPDIAAMALLVLLVALFFWRLWAPNPADRLAFPSGDFTEQYYPLRRFVAATLAEGHLPFWNPYIFGGQPGLADPQAAALYPPAMLNARLWGAAFPLAALQAEAVAHILLAAWGTYAFVRAALRLGILPALVAALLFALGGYLTGFPIEQITILETLAWLPWLLLALHLARPGPPLHHRLLGSALAALVLGCALLAGHPQSALYLAYLSLAYAALKLFERRPTPRTLLPAALPLLLPFGLGVGLAAAQLLPTTRFIEESTREVLNYDFVQSGQSWAELLEVLLPKIVGGTPLYVGILPLLLVPLALLNPIQRAEKRFWLGAALVSLFLSLGGGSALFDLLYLGLPKLSSVRSQERVLILWAWSLALLAAWGVAALQTLANEESGRARLHRYTRWLATFLPAVLLPLLALWWLRALEFAQLDINLEVFAPFFDRYAFFCTLFLLSCALLVWYGRMTEGERETRANGGWPVALRPALLMLLLVLDLFTITRGPHLGEPVERALPERNEVVDALYAWQGSDPARVGVVGNPMPTGNDGMRWGFPLLTGNEPLRLSNSEKFFENAPAWRQYQLLAARYLTSDQNLAEADPAAFEGLARSTVGRASYLVRTRPPMPYAWLVGQAELIEGRNELYKRLEAEEFDPYTLALVEREIPTLSAAGASAGSVVVERRAPGFAEVRVTNPGDGPVLLLFAEPITNGWQLFVDGEPARRLRANSLNVMTLVPPGSHLVTLRYEAPGWQQGLMISLVSLGGVILLLVAALVLWQRERAA